MIMVYLLAVLVLLAVIGVPLAMAIYRQLLYLLCSVKFTESDRHASPAHLVWLFQLCTGCHASVYLHGRTDE